MRRSFVLSAVCLLILLASAQPFSSEASSECLKLSRVISVGDFEGVTITNYGSSPSDLSDISICDGEGIVSFNESVILAPGGSVSVLRSEPDSWFPCDRYLTFLSSAVSQSKFALADDGDQVCLMKGEMVLDCLVYGNTEPVEGWAGEPLQKIPRYRYAYRASVFDTDTSADWRIGTEGMTDIISEGVCDASVIPFVFPDSEGVPVFDALRSADRDIVLCIYTLDHPGVAYILLESMRRGVSVTVLVEGDPAGGMPKDGLETLSMLKNGGADVRLMKRSDDGFRRYTYMHAKYAVVDGSTVIMTSENWTQGSFSSNRGWGVIVNSDICASSFQRVFESDSDLGNTDVRRFEELYPTHTSGTVPPFSYGDVHTKEFRADVLPVFSPDGPASVMDALISGAENRVYSQQLRVQYSWAESPSENPVAWMCQAAERGADTRLMVDVSFDDPFDEDTRDGYGVREILKSGNMEVRCANGGESHSMTHNKGLIVDDSAWVGSVNWTSTSFFHNREAALIMHSAEVADFYSEVFLSDWGPDTESISLKISTEGRLAEGKTFVLSAEGSIVPDGTIFYWDTDSDGIFDREGVKIPVSLGAGVYEISVRAVLSDGSSLEGSIMVEVHGETGKGLLIAAPLVLIGASLLVIKRMRAFKRP